MTVRKTHMVRIDSKQHTKPLSKAQKQFNTLSNKIGKLRARLLEWQNDFSVYHQKMYREYIELQETYNARRIEFLQLLDRAHDSKAFKRPEKKKLKYIITDICDELLVEEPSDLVKMLHDKYSELSFEEKNQAATHMMRSMAEDLFGFDIDEDVDINSPEDLFAHLDEKMHEEDQRIERQKETRGNTGRKQTAKQIAKEQREKAEQQEVQKSLQTVYRKLAADLHPDREPDTEERARKTELMQRANIAYNNKDLLQLLELQLEIEQIDSAHINAMSDRQLQHYLKILKEQSQELEQAIAEELLRYGREFAASYLSRPPKKAMSEMAQDLKELNLRLVAIETDLPVLQDLSHLKIWLRHYQTAPEPDLDELLDLTMAGALFDFDDDDFFDVPKPKKSKKKKTRVKRKKAAPRTV